MLLDYASTLRAGRELVPDFRLQTMQDEQAQLQRERTDIMREEMDFRREDRDAARQAQVTAQQRQGEFQTAAERAFLSGDPNDITRLMLQYPEFTDRMKPLIERMDARQKESDTTLAGSMYARLQNNDPTGAAKILRQRVEAEREAGIADPQDEAILSALDSGDPTEIAVATGMVGMQLAALTGTDTFKAIYGGNEKTTAEKDYEFNVRLYGKEYADRVKKAQDVELITVDEGGQVFDKSSFVPGAPVPSQKGGDPASSGGGGSPAAPDVDRMLAITVQSESGGNPNAVSPKGARGLMQVMPATSRDPGYGLRPSNGSAADDVRLGREYFQTMLTKYGDPAKAWAAYNAGPGALDRALSGGGDWLARMPAETRSYVAKNMRALGGGSLPRIASRQQYDRLPSGTQYEAPDGSMRVKP